MQDMKMKDQMHIIRITVQFYIEVLVFWLYWRILWTFVIIILIEFLCSSLSGSYNNVFAFNDVCVFSIILIAAQCYIDISVFTRATLC